MIEKLSFSLCVVLGVTAVQSAEDFAAYNVSAELILGKRASLASERPEELPQAKRQCNTAKGRLYQERLAALQERFSNGQSFTAKDVEEGKLFIGNSPRNSGEPLTNKMIRNVLNQMVEDGKLFLLNKGKGGKSLSLYRLFGTSEANNAVEAPVDPSQEVYQERLAALQERFSNGQSFTAKDVEEGKLFIGNSPRNSGEPLNDNMIRKVLNQMVKDGHLQSLGDSCGGRTYWICHNKN